ncbi:MAG: hypothetical protein AWU55_2835 [Halomonadaceae bacterium T82-2]|nr:MAG: hypothetical protein AWU55_2835 [Halomonadaceae bacterium T82-2]
MSDNTTASQLPPTGERFLPELDGDIVAEHLHRYLVARRYVAGKNVLDIASGEGYGSRLLAEAAARVTGVDIAHEAVAHARERYVADNLEFRQGDCTAIPLPDASVDVVVSFETIEHHDKHAEMIAEIKRVLRPDGLLIISSPDKREYSDVPGYANPYHVKELYRDEFEALLDGAFRHRRLLGQRVIYGSAILDADDAPLTTYTAHEPEGRPGLEDPVYLIALASDAELPETGSSFFRHDIAHSDVVREREIIIQARELELDERGVAVAERDARLAAVTSERDTLQAECEALSAEREEARRWLHEQATLQSRVHNPTWLAKRLVKRLLQWPSEQRRSRHERYQIANSGLFDPAWYLAHNSDVQVLGLDPLKHYHRYGGFEGRAASPHFDSLEHLRQHPELLQRHVHPLLHHLHLRQGDGQGQGRAQAESGELFDQLFSDAKGHGEEYVALSERPLDEATRIRTIAFYLPQFHPIPENDRWWGKGFTEWTNVAKAVPQFAGHYQPRQPGELGFYDLRLPAVQERQVELARQHGVSGFCFHYYWFSGRRRLLDTPIDQYVANPNIDFPFCICWANENWTRRWDGKESDILMEQRHEPQDDREFIEDVAPLLEDPRYLRVDGKPLLIVYRVDILPDARKTAETWRDYCRERGIGELHLVVAQSFGIGDPRPYGFDAAVEFPPHDTYARRMDDEVRFLNPGFTGHVYDYADLVASQLAKPTPDYVRYRTVFPAWDNEARKPGRGHIFAGSSPARYQQWLAGACREADRLPGDDKLVFVNAWNEWAEGAYLEPDRRYGYAYLEATKQVMAQYPAAQHTAARETPEALRSLTAHHDTAVILHLYHTELWDEIADYLDSLEGQYDLYVSVPEQADAEVERTIRRRVPGAVVVPLANRGRDIAPFLTVLRAIRGLGYGQVCKIHAKRSLHRGDGDVWRREFLGQLLGSRQRVTRIIEAFRQHPEIGLVGPAGHWLAYGRYWGHPESPARTRGLLDHLGISMTLDELHFFAGSMFWCRPEAMDRLLDHIGLDDFEIELGQTDGTLAHALERLFAAACQAAGLRVTDTDAPEATHAPAPAENYPFALPSPPLAQGHAPEPAPAMPPLKRRARQVAQRAWRSARRRLG